MAPEVDSDDENVEYEDDSGHRYRLYLDELEDSSTAPTINSSASLQGMYYNLGLIYKIHVLSFFLGSLTILVLLSTTYVGLLELVLNSSLPQMVQV